MARRAVGRPVRPLPVRHRGARRDVEDLLHGRAAPEVDARMAGLARRGACAHPDGMVAFVASALDVLTDELSEHRRHGGCGRPYAGVLPLGERGVR